MADNVPDAAAAAALAAAEAAADAAGNNADAAGNNNAAGAAAANQGGAAAGAANNAGAADTAANNVGHNVAFAGPGQPMVGPWENLTNSLDLQDHHVAKALLEEHGDTPWEDALSVFQGPYNAREQTVARAIADSPSKVYFLVVNPNDEVQTMYGMKFCHVVPGQGERVLALGGERTVIAGVERPPRLFSLGNSIAAQWANFGSGQAAARSLDDFVAAHEAAADSDLLAPVANPDPNDNVTARRALIIHPKLAALFVRPLSPRDAVAMVHRIRDASTAHRASRYPTWVYCSRCMTRRFFAGRDRKG
jgi:hypothetical protein